LCCAVLCSAFSLYDTVKWCSTELNCCKSGGLQYLLFGAELDNGCSQCMQQVQGRPVGPADW
jgi:hypothetical protein